MNKKVSSESVVKDIRRRTRKKYSSEEKIRIVLDGLRGEVFGLSKQNLKSELKDIQVCVFQAGSTFNICMNIIKHEF